MHHPISLKMIKPVQRISFQQSISHNQPIGNRFISLPMIFDRNLKQVQFLSFQITHELYWSDYQQPPYEEMTTFFYRLSYMLVQSVHELSMLLYAAQVQD